MDSTATGARSLRLRCFAVVSLLTVYLAPVARSAPANAGSGNGSHARAELRAITRVVGDTTASIEVRLSRSARIRAPKGHGVSPDVRVSGRGRTAGVVIVSEDWGGALGPDELLIVNRWGLCDQPGCDPGKNVIHNFRGLRRDEKGRGVLPAGDYTLHILADETPVEVTLRLDGAPQGEAVLRPRGPSAVDFRVPEMTIEQEADGSYTYGAGSDFRSGTNGVSYSLLYVRARQKLNPFNGGICHINSPTGPPPPAYGPQCYALTAVGLGKGFYLINENVEDREFSLLPLIGYHDQGVTPPNVDGRRGLGAWASTPYPLEDFVFMGMFVEAP